MTYPSTQDRTPGPPGAPEWTTWKTVSLGDLRVTIPVNDAEADEIDAATARDMLRIHVVQLRILDDYAKAEEARADKLAAALAEYDKLIDFWFSPWDGWKEWRWEGLAGDDARPAADKMLEVIRKRARERAE